MLNVEQELEELHTRLLRSADRFPDYSNLYQAIPPALSELRQRNNTPEEPKTRIMLNAPYDLAPLTLLPMKISAYMPKIKHTYGTCIFWWTDSLAKCIKILDRLP